METLYILIEVFYFKIPWQQLLAMKERRAEVKKIWEQSFIFHLKKKGNVSIPRNIVLDLQSLEWAKLNAGKQFC